MWVAFVEDHDCVSSVKIVSSSPTFDQYWKAQQHGVFDTRGAGEASSQHGNGRGDGDHGQRRANNDSVANH